MNHLTMGGRVLLGLVFLCSAAGKGRGGDAFRAFRESVGQLVPSLRRRARPLVGLTGVAVATVVAEALVVVLLALPGTSSAGFALAAALLTAFTAALAAALRRKLRATCRCFGGDAPIAPRHIVRNLLLLVVAGTALAVSGPGTGTSYSPSLLLAVGCGAVLALLTVKLDELADLFALSSTRREERTR
ncbi:MauE/DoxX family redox-associated membrane protein [Embleya scabrispora]|uniref:MauE/DoxX family redox-associated membrane protein n=1 Tax=Embleya scabrispora TaxID=159449 RepID=UPI00039E0D10|nr:MauE/DoxX family redox-associated membrane protein [Embleya scabrispora]MYS86156.1 methylamine utilization protein MauE [Streptomyces sp. SID5474]